MLRQPISLFPFPELSPDERSGAIISPCGVYRYHLWRRWDENLPTMVWVMLNPSTADAAEDDPTIRRCIGFAKREGCGGISVRNVFALRATDPSELAKYPDPVGPDNWDYLINARQVSLLTILIAGWGALRPEKRLRSGYTNAISAVMGQGAHCFGVTKKGHPRHPLYLKANAPMIPFKGCA
jgi:hypothetical protein